MTDLITLTGLVATTPRHIVTCEGLSITSFRLASSQRRYDRSAERWIDGETNWYTITSFRQLALNSATSIQKASQPWLVGRPPRPRGGAAAATGTALGSEPIGPLAGSSRGSGGMRFASRQRARSERATAA